MLIRVQTWRKDNIGEDTLKNEFYKLGWEEAGQGGLKNKSYLFNCNKYEEPKFPEGYEYEVINTRHLE